MELKFDMEFSVGFQSLHIEDVDIALDRKIGYVSNVQWYYYQFLNILNTLSEECKNLRV